MYTGELSSILKNYKADNFAGRTVNRLHMMYSPFFEQIRDLDGDVVECGVGVGRTFLVFATIMYRDLGFNSKKLFGFDSFEGFPEPSEYDRSERNPKKGEWNYSSPSDIIWTLKLFKCFNEPGFFLKSFSQSNIVLEKGFFSTELFEQAPKSIALLHLDCDLYMSYKICLENLWPLIVSRGLVIFDEYDTPRFPGAKKSIDEYFEERDEKIQYDAISKKYYVRKSEG
jgi:hypothetical protein